MRYLGIAGIVLLLLFGVWRIFGQKLAAGWSSDTEGYGVNPKTGQKYKRKGQGLSSTPGPDGKQTGTQQAEDGDDANEAQGGKFQKLLEDLSVDAPGTIVPWRRNAARDNVLKDFRIGWHAVTDDELGDNLWVPGILETATQMTYVPIEHTVPYSFLTYDRQKYVILVSSHVDTSMNPVDPRLVVWDRVNRKMLPKLDGNILHYKGEDVPYGQLCDIMKQTLAYREFGSMPSGPTHRFPGLNVDSCYNVRRKAVISFGETRKHLLTIPVMTQPQMLD